jgi:hypothetical protein
VAELSFDCATAVDVTISGVPEHVGAGTVTVYSGTDLFTISGSTNPTFETVTAESGEFTTSLTISGQPVATGTGGAALTVKEEDGTPTVLNVDTIVVTAGTLTDDGGGQVTIDTGADGTGEPAIVGADGITVISGTNTTAVSGFRTEFVSASGSLQTQIDNIDVDEIEPAIVGVDGITVISGSDITTVSGFRDEFVAASGTLSAEIDTDIANHTSIDDAHHSRYTSDENEAITGSDGITIVSGSSTIDVQGFYAEFVAASGFNSDHGNLSGLTPDDDHPHYFLADGSRTLAGNLTFDVGTRTITKGGSTVQNQNLLDKTANETVEGTYTFEIGPTFGDGSSGDVTLNFDGDGGEDGQLIWDTTEDRFKMFQGATNTPGLELEGWFPYILLDDTFALINPANAWTIQPLNGPLNIAPATQQHTINKLRLDAPINLAPNFNPVGVAGSGPLIEHTGTWSSTVLAANAYSALRFAPTVTMSNAFGSVGVVFSESVVEIATTNYGTTSLFANFGTIFTQAGFGMPNIRIFGDFGALEVRGGAPIFAGKFYYCYYASPTFRATAGTLSHPYVSAYESFPNLRTSVGGTVTLANFFDFRASQTSRLGGGTATITTRYMVYLEDDIIPTNLNGVYSTITSGATKRFINSTGDAQSDHTGVFLVKDKVAFTQIDLNEYIDSEADEHLDLAATTAIDFNIGGVEVAAVSGTGFATTGSVYVGGEVNLATAVGSQIPTTSGQLLGFYGATPVDQPETVASGTGVGDIVERFNELLDRIKELGLIKT